MKDALKRIDKAINGLLGIAVIAMLAVMSAVVFAQVVFRLVHASIPWSEELSKYLLIWCTFLGSALGVRKGSLVGLELLFMILPKKAIKPLTAVINLAAAVLLVFLMVIGFRTAAQVWAQTTPILKMPMGLMYASIPVGALFMLINTGISTYLNFCEEDEKE